MSEEKGSIPGQEQAVSDGQGNPTLADIDGGRFSEHAGERYRHVKRGTSYTLPFGPAEAGVQCSHPVGDGDVLLIYIGDDGMIWARPPHEFFDGRFEPLHASTRPKPAIPGLLTEAAEICAILDNYNGHDGETLVYDYEAIGEEVARRHQSLTAAIAKALGASTASPARVSGQVPGMTNSSSQGPTHDQ